MIPKEQAKKHGLPETVQLYNDPGYLFYGLGVYHQLHCLNRIRKTFYKEKFYADEDPHMIEVHKNHCFDVIRQALMCHGDISLVYWWNDTYSYIDETGAKQYSDDYLHRNGEERMTGSRTHWNTDVQCRDISAINDWARQHKVNADKYWGRVDD
ncbi:uncharacterized protein ATNIH1004_009200 [Aspergillus tanneri]|nr:uncharacterized protein ATNIH1004_009200 [Aspergillus tanneri]KAA8644989.1 hypothetical protein ATNIH1004_009200 [Aspergillus tanneri]